MREGEWSVKLLAFILSFSHIAVAAAAAAATATIVVVCSLSLLCLHVCIHIRTYH
jgi:hypothetical protein